MDEHKIYTSHTTKEHILHASKQGSTGPPRKLWWGCLQTDKNPAGRRLAQPSNFLLLTSCRPSSLLIYRAHKATQFPRGISVVPASTGPWGIFPGNKVLYQTLETLLYSSIIPDSTAFRNLASSCAPPCSHVTH